MTGTKVANLLKISKSRASPQPGRGLRETQIPLLAWMMDAFSTEGQGHRSRRGVTSGSNSSGRAI